MTLTPVAGSPGPLRLPPANMRSLLIYLSALVDGCVCEGCREDLVVAHAYSMGDSGLGRSSSSRIESRLPSSSRPLRVPCRAGLLRRLMRLMRLELSDDFSRVVEPPEPVAERRNGERVGARAGGAGAGARSMSRLWRRSSSSR